MTHLETLRAAINRRLTAGEINAGEAQRLIQSLYGKHPTSAERLYDPEGRAGGRFIPHDERQLRDGHYRSQGSRRDGRRLVW